MSSELDQIDAKIALAGLQLVRMVLMAARVRADDDRAEALISALRAAKLTISATDQQISIELITPTANGEVQLFKSDISVRSLRAPAMGST